MVFKTLAAILCSMCLSYVLYAAVVASDGIDQIRAPAGDFPHCVVGETCGVAL